VLYRSRSLSSKLYSLSDIFLASVRVRKTKAPSNGDPSKRLITYERWINKVASWKYCRLVGKGSTARVKRHATKGNLHGGILVKMTANTWYFRGNQNNYRKGIGRGWLRNLGNRKADRMSQRL